MQELLVTSHLVYVNIEQRLNTLETLGELAHCCIMYGVPVVSVLLAEDLPQLVYQPSGIFFK